MIGQEVEVSSRLFSVDQTKHSRASDVEASPQKESVSTSTAVGIVPVLSKAALARAEDLHVNATQLPGAWIAKADVERAAELSPRFGGTIDAWTLAANSPRSKNLRVGDIFHGGTVIQKEAS